MLKALGVLFSIVLLTSCGGGGGSGAGASGSGGTPTPIVATSTGVFKDSNTSGLHYESGGQSGETGADGSFTYEVGQSVTFSLVKGKVILGTILTGKSVVTPLDLISGGSSGDQRVRNLVRFLMLLDSDGIASNGIQISAAVRNSAANDNWPLIDFNLNDVDFTNILSSVLTKIENLDANFTHVLPPNAAIAALHLEATLRCARSGAFKGTYAGAASGRIGLMVDATDGHVHGYGFIPPIISKGFLINGSTNVSYDHQAVFTSGIVAAPPNITAGFYQGQFDNINTISGNWGPTQPPIAGTFSSSRIGGSLNAKYRFTGKFENSAINYIGLYSFDVDALKNVTGVAYNIATDSTETLNGTVSNTNILSGTTSSGTSFTANIDLVGGTVTTGSFNAGLVTGTFTASGCQLN
jgi:hypothetical protein